MRRYLTLVFMLFLVIPAGISFSGCTRNPAGNFCNGLGYGLKDTDVYRVDLEPKTTGLSLAFGQEQQINAPQAFTCKGSNASASSFNYSTTNNKLVDVSPTGRICAGTWNRNSGGGIPDFTICNPPNPVPATNGLPYTSVYVSASVNGVTSNPVQVFVHATVSSVSLALAGNQQCYSQGTSTQLDSEACFSQNGKQYEFCAPASVSPANYACTLPSGVTSVPVCSSSIGTLAYSVSTGSVATLNAATNVITAAQPGTTAISASIAGSGSSAGYFTTCPPKSISVTLNGNTSATVTKGVTQNLVTTVVDTKGNVISGLTLDYQSTNPLDISAGTAGSVLASFPGAASVYAICQPSVCNPAPINQVGLFGTGVPISSNAVNITTPGTASTYVWFGAPGQSQYFVPYDLVGNSLGSTVRLPYVPNSMVMDREGTTIYFGSSHALMSYTTSSNVAANPPDASVPGVVLAVSPDGKQVLINDQIRQVFYIYSTSGSTGTIQFSGVGSAAEWTPDAKTLYITDSASAGPGHTDTLYVYNANTGWTTYDLTSSGGGKNLTLAIPSVGAYLSGNPTVAHTWCPSGTASNYKSIVFYPQGDSVPAQTDVLATTTDGQHVLGAALVGGGVQLSDIGVSVPFTPTSGTGTGGSSQTVNLPDACPQSGSQLNPLLLQHTLNQIGVNGISATALNAIVTSPAQNLAFLTYDGTTPGGTLPYYLPGAKGTTGTLNYLTLTGGNAVLAPIAGAFSLDNQYFFVSTAGDGQIHFVKTSTLTDTQQINPGLPACAPGSDPSCVFNNTTPPASGTVPATVILVKPRNTV
jgi:trimeric autotransporter adhesin